MHRSSESIAALAAALAKAQSELSNPEKSLVGTIGSDRPGEGARTFRYAPLSSGLDIVRKALGQQQIATVQTTAIDASTGTVNLTTVLAHASGEWIASDWPVCRLADSATPHRMGAALTYARRYALFTLVGIAGEDDLDASDLNGGAPGPAGISAGGASQRKPRKSAGSGLCTSRPPILPGNGSAVLRDRLVGEIAGLGSGEEAARWARTALAAKNTLTAADARLVDLAFALRLSSLKTEGGPPDMAQSPPAAAEQSGRCSGAQDPPTAVLGPRSAAIGDAAQLAGKPAGIDKSVLLISEARRHRDKAHLKFVASRPCLICGRRPSDPHHIRFAQVRALGRKVSDEFAVPLCRLHHRELHRSRNEALWWMKFGIDPIQIARRFWDRTRPSPPAQPTTPEFLPQIAKALPDALVKSGTETSIAGKKASASQEPPTGSNTP
jgi:hypothetical protein